MGKVNDSAGRIGQDAAGGMGQLMVRVHAECRGLEQELDKVTKRRAAVWKETETLARARGDHTPSVSWSCGNGIVPRANDCVRDRDTRSRRTL